VFFAAAAYIGKVEDPAFVGILVNIGVSGSKGTAEEKCAG
jgi:hypothetical protein